MAADSQGAFSQQPGGRRGRAALTGSKVAVGCLLPLTGEMSNIGFRVQRGMELAARRVSVKLVFQDTRTDPAGSGATHPGTGPGREVMAILGFLTSAVAQSAADAPQASAVPLIALSQKDGLTQTGNLIFQVFLTPRQQVRAVVRRAQSLAIKRYAVLYPDSTYGRTFSQIFQEEVAAAGAELAAQVYTAPAPRSSGLPWLLWLRVSRPRLRSRGARHRPVHSRRPRAVVATVVGTVRYPSQRHSAAGRQSPEQRHNTGAQMTALQGVFFPDAFFAGDPNPAVQEFIAAYRSNTARNRTTWRPRVIR